MEYEFTNGTVRQKAMWAEAVGHLLHLPSSAIDLKVMVTFQASIPGGHTDLAATTWTYGSTEATTLIRSDALSFGSSKAELEAEAASLGLPYSIEKFYLESAVHELGHALYASLPEANRIAIAQMFGAKSDSITELEPTGSKWQNRIMEGIAETFKEAFLSRRYRVFPNRTKRKIPYNQYPVFRSLFRVGTESVSRKEGFDHDVLELDFKDMRVAWPASSLFRHWESNAYYTVYQAGYNLFSRKISNAHSFSFSFTPPAFLVVDVPKSMGLGAIFFAWRYRIKVNGITQHKFRGVWAGGRPSLQTLQMFYNEWYLPASNLWDAGEGIASPFATWLAGGNSFFLPNELEKEGEGWTNNYETYEDAIPLGPLPITLSDSISVDPGDVVSIHARALGLELAVPGGPNFEEEARERMGRLLTLTEILPRMPFSEAAEVGPPIVVPSSSILSPGAIGGSRPNIRPVIGSFH